MIASKIVQFIVEALLYVLSTGYNNNHEQNCEVVRFIIIIILFAATGKSWKLKINKIP